jgi:uncharacterized protein
MTEPTASTIDLGRLGLSHGEGRRLSATVAPGALELGGQTYAAVPETVEARLDLSRSSSGHAVRMRFATRVEGPCVRCLVPAGLEVAVDAREVDEDLAEDEELRSPYVADAELDVARWAHDALALALPAQILCRPDCAGLCAVCGVSLNDADPAEHRHEEGGDPRWAKLRDLELD